MCAFVHRSQYPGHRLDVFLFHRSKLLDVLQDCVLPEEGLAQTGQEDVEAKELQGFIAQDQFFEVRLWGFTSSDMFGSFW